MNVDTTLLTELKARGLIHQVTEQDPPIEKLLQSPQAVYAGFDPTASSLHVGNLIPLLGLKRFQEAGHKAIALAGGATGMVGDPSGKSAERNLLDKEALQANVASIKAQLEKFLDVSGPRGALVDNLSWTEDVSFLSFLRDVGKHFTINAMMRKDSVKARLERDSGEGISFTEFSYMLLQANDFLHLYQNHGCTVQIGGSDQWGNITAGCELIRRKLHRAAYGLTFPLLQNTDGSKFGKTAQGAVWLDPARTSPFAFRQFWFKSSDDDVISRIKIFTFLPLDEIAALQEAVESKSEPNVAQRKLAQVMTELVHGPTEAARVEKAVAVLFNPKADLRELPAEYVADAFEGAPTLEIPRAEFADQGMPLVDLVVRAVYAGESKRGAARRDISANAISINGSKWTDEGAVVKAADLLHDRFVVVRKGKRNNFLVRVVE